MFLKIFSSHFNGEFVFHLQYRKQSKYLHGTCLQEFTSNLISFSKIKVNHFVYFSTIYIKNIFQMISNLKMKHYFTKISKMVYKQNVLHEFARIMDKN